VAFIVAAATTSPFGPMVAAVTCAETCATASVEQCQ
jgi:hypothetical protein